MAGILLGSVCRARWQPAVRSLIKMPWLRRSDYDQAVTTASPQSEPDVLTVGLGEAGRLSRRGKFVLVAIVLALLAGLMLWRFLPARAPLFSLSDVQGVYAGMVRADGTNDASVIDPRWSSEQDGYIVPAACGPLFEATVLNRAPARSARRSQHLLGDRSFGGLAFHLSVRRRVESGPGVQSAGHSARQLRSGSRGGARAPGEQGPAHPYAAGSRQRSASTDRLRPDQQRRRQAGDPCARLQQHCQLAVSL